MIYCVCAERDAPLAHFARLSPAEHGAAGKALAMHPRVRPPQGSRSKEHRRRYAPLRKNRQGILIVVLKPVIQGNRHGTRWQISLTAQVPVDRIQVNHREILGA